ncbi:prepilin-type N-terminal cleavage/methylation domain-containing protein [Flagellimonas sp. 389]|uniref:prepilin-type N-terminal cleavage/methylation domain-containing protein n=1 Tax=Flagellimonas sp. 389 TaxID=2835862 RepID=UPI001BD33854|nr:prepilin-type N-terminal cleavage/methylation domain-containing protein [Flagellimonas sp. 389]MBS9464167.1 prepilin-type N-terminal cleavage/methylation domain-containing protein [Flagellimonas sp. 389]
MSKTCKKIKAFTLSEMLVVLLLTLIVVGLAFSVLGLVQGQMNDIQISYEERAQDNLLQQALWIDFNSYSNIYFSSQEGALVLANEIEKKEYRFRKEYVVNENDTIFTDFKINKAFFWGKEVNSGKVDALEFINEGEQIKTLFVYKRNAATDFMN